ncbi:hypothetical protein OG943_38725 [Amycolatopsis sp. NBC_00345]|uniref:hypothetical protein n=1 Tax=Amycolatopsis sp. NBC_00345 TaxID=2975955 RepID=UPI002E26E608
MSAAFFTGELFPAVFPLHAERTAVAAIAPPIIARRIVFFAVNPISAPLCDNW